MHSNLRQILVWNWHRSRSCCWMVWNHNGPLWVLSQCTHQQQQRLWWCYEHTQILPYTLCLYVYHKNHTTQIHRHTYQYIISINYSTGSHLVVMGAIHHLRFFSLFVESSGLIVFSPSLITSVSLLPIQHSSILLQVSLSFKSYNFFILGNFINQHSFHISDP